MADIAGVLRGGDFSHHQEDLNLGLLPLDFFICRTAQAKGGQYATTIDRAYAKHKANVARVGKAFSSYFYLGNGLSPAANAALHASVEPDRSVPVMLDWENGSGNGAFLRASYEEFGKLGYFVWGLYAPRWYWLGQGSPDLSWAPPLVSSRYADNTAGNYEQEYASTPESYWAGYGGNSVRMLQFTSSGRLQPYPTRSLDLDAFKGTRADLAAWWNRNKPNPGIDPADQREAESMERFTVTPPNAGQNMIRVYLPGTPQAAIICRPRLGQKDAIKPMWAAPIYAWGQDGVGIGHNPSDVAGYNPKLTNHRKFDLPGALWADFWYSAAEPFELEIVG
jgi:hypothetical protein